MIKLGEFEVTSGRLIISDPCYETDAAPILRGVVEQCLNGAWTGFVEKIDAGDWGVRCSAVYGVHTSVKGDVERQLWVPADFFVMVDSGQAGIFDSFVYRNPETVTQATDFDPDDPWYSLCCDITLSELGAGVITGGVVSSSGFGDGGYGAFVLQNADGQITGVKIQFIHEEQEDEDESG